MLGTFCVALDIALAAYRGMSIMYQFKYNNKCNSVYELVLFELLETMFVAGGTTSHINLAYLHVISLKLASGAMAADRIVISRVLSLSDVRLGKV